ncbi:MAG: hypothetical protein J3Q66DRAFT_66684 [Benniella sp.]|nr:MAG: hypothetical protein J3Q66DRAFT_66684 [Benniella sp.]
MLRNFLANCFVGCFLFFFFFFFLSTASTLATSGSSATALLNTLETQKRMGDSYSRKENGDAGIFNLYCLALQSIAWQARNKRHNGFARNATVKSENTQLLLLFIVRDHHAVCPG